MRKIDFFYPTGHEAHSESNHPERPARVEAIRKIFEDQSIWDELYKQEPANIPQEVITAIHTPEYLEYIKTASEKTFRPDMDTYITPDTYRLALNAAGGAVAVASSVWQRDAACGFALTRPPGHHATPNQAMGFCLINNIAVAAEHLIQAHGAKRIAIVDIDLHHGNGTQDIFYSRNDVLFFSIHQSPLYPGTGPIDETGQGHGEGLNANLPLPPNSGDQAYLTCIQEIIFPLLDKYQPEILLISAGFDAHWRDPLGNLLVSTQCYGEIISQLSQWADSNCNGRIALFLEGGYDVEAGAYSALAATKALLGEKWDDPLGLSHVSEEFYWHHTIDQAKIIWNL